MQSMCTDSQFSLQFPNSFHPLIPYSDFISNAVPCSYEWTIFVGVFLLKDLRNVSVQDFSKTYSNVDPVLITEKDSFLEYGFHSKALKLSSEFIIALILDPNASPASYSQAKGSPYSSFLYAPNSWINSAP